MCLFFEDWVGEENGVLILLVFGDSVSGLRLILCWSLLDWEVGLTGASQMLYGLERDVDLLPCPCTGVGTVENEHLDS